MEISVYDQLLANEFQELDFQRNLRDYWIVYPYRHDNILFKAARNNETLKRRLLDGALIVAALEHQLGDSTQLSNPSPTLEQDLRELIGYQEERSNRLWGAANITGRVVLTALSHSPIDAVGIGFTMLNIGAKAITRDKAYKNMRKRAEFIDYIVKSSDLD